MGATHLPRIGISGWRYKPWRGTFYPEDLAQKRELAYASRQLNSIEINGSFYSLQRPSSWKSWYEQTPDDFVFSIKGSRYITHMLKLKGVAGPLANFFSQGLLALGEKLGPILWQFPPIFRFDPERLGNFFDLLPRDAKEAEKLAEKHTALMKGRTFFKARDNRPLRHAMEVRHDSFKCPEFITLLRKHDVALVVADTARKWPFLEDLTSDFVYARLHGDQQLYTSGYTPKALDTWAGRVNAWIAGAETPEAMHASPKPAKKRKHRDVYMYFDNDVKVRAPFDAMGLAQRTGGYVPERPPLEPPAHLPHEARAHWPIK
ncbi:MAG TPA: DUF72 domain-containing protein [Phycisphaerae bacterium]|nr:DUF72 domain-containing protein [Phycisphaerae bacterium]